MKRIAIYQTENGKIKTTRGAIPEGASFIRGVFETQIQNPVEGEGIWDQMEEIAAEKVSEIKSMNKSAGEGSVLTGMQRFERRYPNLAGAHS